MLSPDASRLVTHSILLAPLPFAIAHLHHLHAQRLANPTVPLLHLVLASLFQFAYTALFGWYAAFVLVRTGSLLAVIVCHAFCNWMGLPRVWGHLYGADYRSGPSAWHTVAYYTLLMAGAFGFAKALWPLTESERVLVRGY